MAYIIANLLPLIAILSLKIKKIQNIKIERKIFKLREIYA
jgi:hypothetical protein